MFRGVLDIELHVAMVVDKSRNVVALGVGVGSQVENAVASDGVEEEVIHAQVLVGIHL